MWSNKANTESAGLIPGRKTIGPLLLMFATTTFVVLCWMTQEKFHGSLSNLFSYIIENGFIATLKDGVYGVGDDYSGMVPTMDHWKILAYFSAFELILMKLPVGREFNGPVTPEGNVPKYTDNAFASYVITIVTFIVGVEMEWWKGSILITNWGPMLFAMNIFALFFCIFLTLKGLYFPSTTDCGTTGNFIVDFYWGTELYPRIFGWDVKVFTNCRFGLMLWALLPISVAYAQKEEFNGISNEIIVNCLLQLVYLSKFYWWESGYMSTVDIMHDRAGYYICWGCLVWVPTIYTMTSQYIYFKFKSQSSLNIDNALSAELAMVYVVLGIASIFANYDADNHRAVFRQFNGNVNIFGSPAKCIVAKYTPQNGKQKTSLLLLSGYWGISRHFHYLPEILLSIFWCIPAGFDHFLPHFYYIFLTILLMDRSVRDEGRCTNKYGKYYLQYKEEVPYKIIPGVF